MVERDAAPGNITEMTGEERAQIAAWLIWPDRKRSG
jgi:uncharacterized membrane protein